MAYGDTCNVLLAEWMPWAEACVVEIKGSVPVQVPLLMVALLAVIWRQHKLLMWWRCQSQCLDWCSVADVCGLGCT